VFSFGARAMGTDRIFSGVFTTRKDSGTSGADHTGTNKQGQIRLYKVVDHRKPGVPSSIGNFYQIF